jgi:hypothetical protein
MENTSLVLFLSLKIMGMLPKVYKSECGYLLSKTSHLATINFWVQIN